MIVSEHEREGGGHTVQFMDAAGDKELIISAWPYTQLDLTLGRITAGMLANDRHHRVAGDLRELVQTCCVRLSRDCNGRSANLLRFHIFIYGLRSLTPLV